MSDAIFSMTPTNLEEAQKFAEMIAGSGLCPKGYEKKPTDILIAMQQGAELGMKPLQSLQGIAVVNGRPTVWGDAMLAIVRASGLLEDFAELDPSEALARGYGECTVVRRGQKTACTRRFTIEEAKQAGIWGRNVWATYPGRMLMFRARAFTLRDTFGDVLKGMQMREEVEDYDVVTTAARAITEDMMPKRLTNTAPTTRPAPTQPAANAAPQSDGPPVTGSRAKLVGIDEKKKSSDGKPFFVCAFEDSNGRRVEASTFSVTTGKRLLECVGQVFDVDLETKTKGDKTYTNLVAIEPVQVNDEEIPF